MVRGSGSEGRSLWVLRAVVVVGELFIRGNRADVVLWVMLLISSMAGRRKTTVGHEYAIVLGGIPSGGSGIGIFDAESIKRCQTYGVSHGLPIILQTAGSAGTCAGSPHS